MKISKSTFPEVIEFERLLAKCYYKHIAFRPPRQGEFYLSGAIVQAWRAPNNLSIAYHVIQPTHHAKKVSVHKKGAKVKLPAF